MRKNKYYAFDGKGEKIYFGDYGTNESGIQPVEDKVLLLPDAPCDEIRGIIKPDTTKEMERMAQVRALLVAVGGNCFENWDEPIPKIGDRVMIMKYAGIHDIEGADGRYYQLTTDRDITAILEDESHVETLSPRKGLGLNKGDKNE